MMLGKGDVVKLKSSHTKMIVAKAEQIGEQTVVNCVWFDQDHKLQRGGASRRCLRLPTRKIAAVVGDMEDHKSRVCDQ